MKKFLSLFAFLIITVSGYALDLHIPKPVDMMMYSKPSSKSMYAVAKIYPVGWSKNGYFAFIQENDVEGRGGVAFSYIIINTITDKIVWNHLDDWVDSNDVNIKQSIERVKKVLSKHLMKYQIIQNRGVEFYSFPLIQGEQVFSPNIEIIKKQEKDPFLGDIQSVSIFMNKGTKKKRIFFKQNPRALSYWISGYFLSPYEKRILVSIGQEKWGFEGTEGSFIFSGSSLVLKYK